MIQDSIEEVKIFRVVCASPHCQEKLETRYNQLGETFRKKFREVIRRAGWDVKRNRWYCPSCVLGGACRR